MKQFTLITAFILTSIFVNAQTEMPGNPQDSLRNSKSGPHKIIFQLTTDDTLAQKALMKQLNNLLTLAPDAKLEVVCHGPGISMLLKAKSKVQDKIDYLHTRGVQFVACEFTMRERNITRPEIVSASGFVRGGILEIAIRQEEGWTYIKSGF